MNDDDDVLAARRPLGREALARISPLPPPEEVFFDWLVSVPHGACLEEAARREIARIDRVKAAMDAGLPITAGAAAVSLAIPPWASFTFPQDAAETGDA